MPPLMDAKIIAKFRTAFEERCSGGVRWKQVPAAEWVRKNLDGCSTQAIDCLILKHIASGGEISQVQETREGYRHLQYHYDFRIEIDGKRIYVETTLADVRMGPLVTVVNVHDA